MGWRDSTNQISVPIRGLFHLTLTKVFREWEKRHGYEFPSPSGDYLI